MSNVNPARLFGALAAVLVFMGGLALMKGALLIGKHEADTLHLLQIVLRLDAGQWPHLDFMTPIGALAFAPIAWFIGQGMGVGQAIIAAQIALAAVLLPAVWWVGISRMRGLVPYLFGAVVLVMATALAFGLAEPTISVSMYYNRWAWAIAFVAIGAAVLPALGAERPVIDGAIIGGCMAALVLLKMTYFVGFAPAVIAGLLLRKSYKTLGASLFSGGLVLAVVTLFAGLGFWQAYLNDLLLVAGSEVRAQPGEDLRGLIFGPAYLGGVLAAVAAVILLRQAGERAADQAGSFALMLLVPGFLYVQFQNFGNDAQWLPMLAILLFSLRPDASAVGRWGWNLRAALNVTGVVTLALAAPSLINLASSPYRHLGQNPAWYEPILPHSNQHSDLMLQSIRSSRVEARVVMQAPQLADLAAGALREEPAVLQGEILARCELEMGLVGWINAIAQDLQQAGLSTGKKLFVADAFSSHWMFSDLQPVPNGAPWYYGGLPGIAAADYLLVPLCPAEPNIRKQVLDAIKARPEISLTEIRRTALYVLLDIDLKP